MNKALVTGANGFVGTAVCHALAEYGINVIAVIKDEGEDISQLNDVAGIRLEYSSTASGVLRGNKENDGVDAGLRTL